MPTELQENKRIPDSMLSFGNKRLKEARELAQTKFGKSLIITSVNRLHECFDIVVMDPVTESDVKAFEELWPMCKVQIVKPITRKK